jgi:hypothetical protein
MSKTDDMRARLAELLVATDTAYQLTPAGQWAQIPVLIARITATLGAIIDEIERLRDGKAN